MSDYGDEDDYVPAKHRKPSLRQRIREFFRGPLGYTGPTGCKGDRGDDGRDGKDAPIRRVLTSEDGRALLEFWDDNAEPVQICRITHRGRNYVEAWRGADLLAVVRDFG
jgi:hypothetical protein